MESNIEKNVEHQMVVARNIKQRNLREWHAKIKKYQPEYVADLLFYKSGIVADMLEARENGEFKFDPETVEGSARLVLDILENIDRNHPERANRLYSNFGNHMTRTTYVFPLLDHLDVYHVLEREVVNDLKMALHSYPEGSEEREILENRVRNVQARAEGERKEIEQRELNSKYDSQPY